MPDEGQRRNLFVPIDRAMRWVFVRRYADQREVNNCDFLWRLYPAASMKISKILTDNGGQFTDRFTGKTKQPSGKNAFDKRRTGLEIEHQRAPLRHPQTHAMVERFNGCFAEVIGQTQIKSGAEFDATLTRYVQTYHHRISQRARARSSIPHPGIAEVAGRHASEHPRLRDKPRIPAGVDPQGSGSTAAARPVTGRCGLWLVGAGGRKLLCWAARPDRSAPGRLMRW